MALLLVMDYKRKVMIDESRLVLILMLNIRMVLSNHSITIFPVQTESSSKVRFTKYRPGRLLYISILLLLLSSCGTSCPEVLITSILVIVLSV